MNLSKPIRILVVDDDEDDFFIFKQLLAESVDYQYELQWASSYESGKTEISRQTHDVCFLDYRLSHRTGLDLLKEMIQEGCKTPMILLTGYGEHEVDLEAMKIGASDYLIKDQLTPFLLERSIRYSIHRSQTAQALRERDAQIMTQDRLASIGLLASSLAHEIGTPLGVIRGRAEYLALQVDEPGVKKNVDIIVSQIDRVSKLILSLLNLARGDQNKISSEIDLVQVVSEVLELMAHELKAHDIQVLNLVKEHALVAVQADAGPLHQVLLNLLVNSIHAIDSSVKSGRSGAHFIRISVQEDGRFWTMLVEDDGCGISEKNIRNLFKPFFTTKEIGQGTGLGLATSFRIVESWGGSIQVASKEGEGTVFKILLPRANG